MIDQEFEFIILIYQTVLYSPGLIFDQVKEKGIERSSPPPPLRHLTTSGVLLIHIPIDFIIPCSMHNVALFLI